MKFMMESYELGKNTSSEEVQSQENAENSKNVEAVDLNEQIETVGIQSDTVIEKDNSISDKASDPEILENAGNEVPAENENQSVNELSKSLKRKKSKPPAKDQSRVDESKSNSAGDSLTNLSAYTDAGTAELTIDLAQSEELHQVQEIVSSDMKINDVGTSSEAMEAVLLLEEPVESKLSEPEAEPVTKKKSTRTKKSVPKEKIPADAEEISPKDSDTEKVESLIAESKQPVKAKPKKRKVTEEESVNLIKEEVIQEDGDILGESETDFTEVPVHDYSSYSKIQLISTLRKMIDESPVEEIRPHAEAIKACFYKLRNAEVLELKQAFIAQGNEEELFETEPDPIELELKDLLKEYKNLRAEINKKQDVVKEENYQKKLAIIDEIKSLINSEESLNNTFQEFNDLQDRWRKIGQVPQNRVKDLWENYHYHVELFYDYVKINRELRDLDLRRNLDLKVELCKKAEDISSNNSNVLSSFRELQKLHESWREIGPVPRENKQDIWERFKSATSLINKRYQQFFELERAAQREQLQKKIKLCEMAEVYAGFVSDNPREWNAITDKVIALQEEWKKSGFGPRKENAKIWERFRVANDAFFQNKRNFWNKSKEQLNKNLGLKLEICEQAENLRESDDWKATTDRLITLQKKWKEVGPVPRKQSELIWKRFRTACDEFFNRKTQYFSGITGDQDENYKAKKALLAEIESFKPSGDTKENIESLKKFQERWSEIGFVPFRKKEELQTRYRDLIEAQFDKLKLDDHEVMLYKFKSKIEHWASIPGGWGKINTERDRSSQHLKQLESDINTLANNVGFFGSSKGAQSLIQGVNAQIDKIRLQIDYLKAKIKIIDEQDEIN
jgi:hypothetical protein